MPVRTEDSKFEALFQYATMGILVADASGVITMANKHLQGLFGYSSPEELIGKKVEVLIPKRYQEDHTRYREDYNEEPTPRAMGHGRDLFAVRKDGSEFPVEVSLSHYRSKNESFIIAYVTDITRRKEIEKDMVEQREKLAEINRKMEEMNEDLERKVDMRTEQLQKLMQQIEASRDDLSKALNKEKELSDLKSRFVSMASHEFRTPLSTILSSASLLARYTEKEEQPSRDKHIQRIKASVNNLTAILNEFLSIGRIEDGKIQPQYVVFNVVELVKSVCNEMQTLVTQGQVIEYKHTGNEEILLDPSLLRNIVVNLLSNAIKFSYPDGKITVKTKADDSNLTLTVKDRGIGISKKDQEHLFERFFRARNVINIQGTGLGLHIVARYVDILNGDIEYFSELEKGTTFTLKLPLKEQQ